MTQKWMGFSSISTRLRIVLFTVALLVIAQPVLVYFTTDQVISRQVAVTDRLIQSEIRVARLAREVSDVANRGRSIHFLTDADQLQKETAQMAERIDALIADFSLSRDSFQQNDTNLEMSKKLVRYRGLIFEVTAANIDYLNADDMLGQRVVSAGEAISRKSAVIAPDMVAHQIELDRDINTLVLRSDDASVAAVRKSFEAVVALNTITAAVKSEQFFLSTIVRDENLSNVASLRARMRAQTRNLAFQIAKLPDGPVKSALAENTIKVTEELFGLAGIFEQIDLREAAQIR